MNTRHEMDGIDQQRRAALLLGFLGASAVALGSEGEAVAQQAVTRQVAQAAGVTKSEVAEGHGVTLREFPEVPSVVPGFAKVKLQEATWQPGGKIESTMTNAMICEMSEGALDETKNGKPVKRNKGDMWTCAVGDHDVDVNNGTVPATMRIFNLLQT